MARTPAQTQALIKKANAQANKSEGMRDLFDAGLTVAEVRDAFGTDTPYGYVYGVATRWAKATGNAIPVAPREAKAPKAATTTKAAKPAAKTAPARPAAKAKAAPVETRSKAAIASAKRRAAAKAAKA